MPSHNLPATLTNVLTPIEPEVGIALPPGVDTTPARLIAGAKQALENNWYLRKIAEQNTQSLVNSVLTGAHLGLSIDGVTGQGFLVPFGGQKPAVQFMPGYKGYVTLADKGGYRLFGDVVHEADQIEIERAHPTEPIRHKIDARKSVKERGPIIGAYALATKPGADAFSVWMSIDEIHDVRARSASWRSPEKRNSSPWETNYRAMVRKSPIRALGALLPLHTTQIASALDAAAEFGSRVDYLGDDRLRTYGKDGELIQDGPVIDALPGAAPVDAEAPDAPRYVYERSGGEQRFFELPDIWQGHHLSVIDRIPFDNLKAYWSVNRPHVEAAREAGAVKQADAVQRAYNARLSAAEAAAGGTS